MKRCPTCSRTFEDTLTYCLIDGSVLSAPFSDERGGEPGEATQVLQSNEVLNSTTENTTSEPPLAPTMTAMYQQAGSRRIQPPDTMVSTPEKPYVLLALAIVSALFFVFGITVLIVLNRNQFLSSTIFLFLRRTPLILMAAIGILLSVVRLKRYPRASVLTILALVLFTFAGIFFSLLLQWLTRNMSAADTGRVYDVAVVIEDFVFASETILLVAAAYSDRLPIRRLMPEGI